MNPYQKLLRDRLARRFSTHDGVRLPDGRIGVVQSQHHDPALGYVLWVQTDPKTPWVRIAQDAVESVPAANRGKYGGPSRGGAMGGWTGGNHYRVRKPRVSVMRRLAA